MVGSMDCHGKIARLLRGKAKAMVVNQTPQQDKGRNQWHHGKQCLANKKSESHSGIAEMQTRRL
jgi:hypothetical protein